MNKKIAKVRPTVSMCGQALQQPATTVTLNQQEEYYTLLLHHTTYYLHPLPPKVLEDA
jgi:hypothetical protein